MKVMSICLAQYLWFSSWGSYWPCSFSWFRGNLKNLSNLSCSSLQNLSICPCNDNYYDHTIYWYVLRFTSCLISISSKLESFFVWRVKVGFISCHFESLHSLLGPHDCWENDQQSHSHNGWKSSLGLRHSQISCNQNIHVPIINEIIDQFSREHSMEVELVELSLQAAAPATTEYVSWPMMLWVNWTIVVTIHLKGIQLTQNLMPAVGLGIKFIFGTYFSFLEKLK